jgi:hypothetical protein
MASQSAVALLRVTPLAGAPARVEAVLKLACGCVVTRAISADRVAESVDGEMFPVGKYPCPENHPPGGPRRPA